MDEGTVFIGKFLYCFGNTNTGVVLPLMEFDDERQWFDLTDPRLYQLFPDNGLVVWFNIDQYVSKEKVIRFGIRPTSNYIQGDYRHNAKFQIDKNNVRELWEMISGFPGSENDIRNSILSGNMIYDRQVNSKCLVALGSNRWIGPLRFVSKDPSQPLRPVHPENWHILEIRQINTKERIAPNALNGRVFVEPDKKNGEIVDHVTWEPEEVFIKHLLKYLHGSEDDTRKNLTDLKDLGAIFKEQHFGEAMLHRVKGYENMDQLQQTDRDAIVHALLSMEPIRTELEEAKEKAVEEALRNAEDALRDTRERLEQELEPIKLEKNKLHQEISKLQQESKELGQAIATQRDSMSRMLDEFEYDLAERFDKLAIDPTSMLAETLANDVFLRLIVGRDRPWPMLTPSSHPIHLVPLKQGSLFETPKALLDNYQRRLGTVYLDPSLAVWILAIVLSGLMPVFGGSTVRRALDVFVNHVSYSRRFELPLSPEVIGVERLFEIGRTNDEASESVLETALLQAVTHQEALFVLILEGLDRAPNQYFLDTLLAWYTRGRFGTSERGPLAQRLERLVAQKRLELNANGWPPNLLLVATASGLSDGFAVSQSVLGQIVEVNLNSVQETADANPEQFDRIASKPAGEIAAKSWKAWYDDAALDQDVNPMARFISTQPDTQSFSPVLRESALRIFAALLALGETADSAIELVKRYLLDAENKYHVSK